MPSPDPQADSNMLDSQGREVRSQLHGELLIDLAEQSQGTALIVGTDPVDLVSLYQDVIAAKPHRSREGSEQRDEQPEHRFQWLIAASLMLLMLESLSRSFGHGKGA